MAEKYTKVFSLEGPLYSAGAPVIIEAGALLKVNETNSIIAQIKFKNISKKEIRALTVNIAATDISGAALEGIENFQYLDLKVARGEVFGAKTPITLPDAVTRSFACQCTRVIFADGSKWDCEENAQWNLFPIPVLLKDEIGAGLAEQYKRETHDKAIYKIADHENMWYCACGTLNDSSEKTCYHCKAEKSALLAALNTDKLTDNKKQLDLLLDSEKKAKQKKITAISIIAVASIVVLLFLTLVLPNLMADSGNYKLALAKKAEGKYAEAIEIFTELGDYKDSSEQILECKYAIALRMFERGQIEEALVAFGALGDYKDSEAKCEEGRKELKYQKALDNQRYMTEESYAELKALGDYKDAQQLVDGFAATITHNDTAAFTHEYDVDGKLFSISKSYHSIYTLYSEKFYFNDKTEITEIVCTTSNKTPGSKVSYETDIAYSNISYKYEGDQLVEFSYDYVVNGYTYYLNDTQGLNGPYKEEGHVQYLYTDGAFSQRIATYTRTRNDQELEANTYAKSASDYTNTYKFDGKALVVQENTVFSSNRHFENDYSFYADSVNSLDIPAYEFIYDIYTY